MYRRAWLKLAVATSTCPMALIACGNLDEFRQKLDSRLIAALTPGRSSPDDVIAVLDALELEHSSYRQQGHYIRAIQRDVQKNLLVSTAVQIEFLFDQDHRLEHWTFREVHTGM